MNIKIHLLIPITIIALTFFGCGDKSSEAVTPNACEQSIKEGSAAAIDWGNKLNTFITDQTLDNCNAYVESLNNYMTILRNNLKDNCYIGADKTSYQASLDAWDKDGYTQAKADCDKIVK